MAIATSAPTSVARLLSSALWGLEAALVTVEVDVAHGLPHFSVVGLPDTAISEARAPVRAATRAPGFDFALPPAGLRATGQLTADTGALCLGELALDGRVRAVRGVMPRVRGALGAGIVDVICATESASEAAAAGANAVGVSTLREAVAHIAGEARRP